MASKNKSDQVLVWLSVWSKVQVIKIIIQFGLTFLVPDYPGSPEKESIKWVSLFVSVSCAMPQ